MPINFPDSPSNGATYTVGTKTWQFDGTTWNLLQSDALIGTGSVTSDKIASDAVTTAKILDANITAGKLASNAVTEAKINSGAVTQDKLASGLSGITVTTTANRSAVIPSPFNGQFIFLTDTSQLQRWDGSSWVVAITTVPTGAPASVAVSGSPTSSTVTLTFSAGSDGGSTITNYQYALSTNAGSTYGSYTALSPADGTSPITITGLGADITYYVKLKAVNALGAGSSESSAVSFTTAALPIEYLVIAGGGAGGAGWNGGGGGGAGGFRTNVTGATSGGGASAEAALSLANGTYTVTVGAGGTGNGGSETPGGQGTTSLISGTGITTISTVGGGGGGCGYQNNNGDATTGGSGGGGWSLDPSTTRPGAAGTANQGYAGATSSVPSAWASGGGGGGAGAVGITSSTNTGGTGGAGVVSSISGSSTPYAGGGGGGRDSRAGGTSGSGGSGGGGAGSNGSNSPVAGAANTGGAGGGAAYSARTNGAAGGSGVVIVRYLTADATGKTITGGTATTSGSYTVRTFNASGSLVIA